MLTYRYDEKGIFVGAEEAFLDPLETKLQGKEIYLLGANCTFTKPEEKAGFVPVWNGESWGQVEDNRGVKYWLPGDKYGDSAREMTELGTLPEGASLTEPEQTEEEKAAQELARAKAERAEAVSRITVEVDGMTFDGDEAAQSRMTRAIQAAEVSGLTQAKWVLANNEVVVVNLDQIKKALAQSVIAMGDLWAVPYEKAPDNLGLAKVGI